MKSTIKALKIFVFFAVIISTIIACGPPRLKGTVSIEGDSFTGNTLIVNTNLLGGSGIISYQWMRDGATVDSLDGTTYTLQVEADKDALITVTVIRSDNTGSVTSAPIAANDYLLLKGTVSIDGEPLLGNRLSANTVSLGGNGTISYQWLRNGNEINRSNNATYTLQEADRDTEIKVTVVRAGNYGSVTSDSIKMSLPILGGIVRIDDVGNSLRANTASLGGNGTISFQWFRNGNSINQSNNNTYDLQSADRNAVITVMVSRSGNSGSVTSAPLTIHYLIGDTGPGGGKIFYRDAGGFIMSNSGEKAYYLEVAPVNQGTSLAWASSGFEMINITGTGTAIGTGMANTTAILAIDTNAPAARVCKEYSNNGKSDWFLPSIGELKELYKQRSLINITAGWLWSSSQYNDGHHDEYSALGQNFGNYDIQSSFNQDWSQGFGTYKGNIWYYGYNSFINEAIESSLVRAIRAF